MELVCRDFLLSWKSVFSGYHWWQTDNCVIDGPMDTDNHTHEHLACSCMDNTCRTHQNDTKTKEIRPGAAPSQTTWHHHSKVHWYSQSSLKMNSSSWYLTQRTDYISPNKHQPLQATFRLCVGTQDLAVIHYTGRRSGQPSRGNTGNTGKQTWLQMNVCYVSKRTIK